MLFLRKQQLTIHLYFTKIWCL